jgi:hypothetical protein
MNLPNIKSYNGSNASNTLTFYVLSKGENAGKPLNAPCPSWGLWKSKSFHINLRGSVIPFLRICDYSEVIERACLQTINKPQQLAQALETMRNLEELEKTTLQKLITIKQMRVAVFHKVLRRE